MAGRRGGRARWRAGPSGRRALCEAAFLLLLLLLLRRRRRRHRGAPSLGSHYAFPRPHFPKDETGAEEVSAKVARMKAALPDWARGAGEAPGGEPAREPALCAPPARCCRGSVGRHEGRPRPGAPRAGWRAAGTTSIHIAFTLLFTLKKKKSVCAF